MYFFYFKLRAILPVKGEAMHLRKVAEMLGVGAKEMREAGLQLRKRIVSLFCAERYSFIDAFTSLQLLGQTLREREK